MFGFLLLTARVEQRALKTLTDCFVKCFIGFLIEKTTIGYLLSDIKKDTINRSSAL